MGSRGRREPAVLVEVTPSRWDDDPISRSRALLTGLAGTGGVSLEYAASGDGLRFYLRAASADAMRKAIAQLRPAYPQASLIEVAIEDRPHLDPAWRAHGEEMAALELRLSRGADLPLTCDWRNRGDPLRAALAAASTLRDGERIVCQLVLAPAPPGWADGLRSRSQRRPAQGSQGRDASPTQEILPFLALFGVGAIGLQGYRWYQAGDILPLVGAGAAGLLGLPLAMAVVARFLSGRQLLDQDLIEQKLAHPAFAAYLRVLAFGSAGVSRERLFDRTARVAEAYQAYDHPAGNGLRARRWRGDPTLPAVPKGLLHRPDIFNAAELAGLWHLPDDPSGLPMASQAAARRIVPANEEVARGCRVGVSMHQGRRVPAYLPHGLLFRNHLVVAKTRRGKSTLLVHMASYLMERMAAGRERLLLVVVDPHQDLAEAVLGIVPSGLKDRVTYLNLAGHERPVGLNLLDVALFPSRDRTAENVVTMLHRLWPDNWGPRMEGALRAALMSLHEANQARPREGQYTLLDVVPTLSSADFREEVLKQVPDRALWAWWRDNYDRLGRTMQQQTANPVTTKVGRFLVTEAARLVLGQSCSTFDPRSMLREGGVLVVNSAVGLLGEGGAALVGATVLNLLGLVVEEQVALPPAQRSRLVALVDESSTLGAADYPRMLSELGKYGASFVLVTQSLSKLDAIDESLRPTVFSNIDGLTVFQVSAQDARYLAPELGGGLEVDDLTGLDDFECYARWWADGRRLPTFSLRLDPPPPLDRARLLVTATRSAERFGRLREEVAKEIDDALVRRGVNIGPSGQAVPGVGSARDGEEELPDEVRPTEKHNPKARRRSENRDRK
ncbi:MAG: TraM recognition domain-containing protein [Dehalococcoidia bacterium]|nr:TraM recognition domain-containing protein [Dehalococcoidia bacterium]